ncbi:MAG: polysaccharide biosynthesis/export family protein [Lentimicrobiaceae bacterium]|nr:polysaccharide biosynthesis/export family protein [Lentimicrobiaceae bacterium]MCB9023060.1 polysaccharide biosynthesis/export family protein [Lentimicrobiaceae bacterium]
MNNSIKSRSLLIFMLAMLTLGSCVPQEKLKYVQDETTTILKSEYNHARPIKRIQPFDNLYIKVLSIEEATARIFSNESNLTGGLNINLISYTVNEQGNIDFPFVGEINVNNLTLKEAKEKIEKELSQYLSNTSITIKFVNSNITVLGEVKNQGEFPFFKDQLNIFQAIGFAGGITDYGDKSKITLVREKNGIIQYYSVDLTDKNIVETDFFYLQPNDIVIVEPIKTKFRNLRTFTYSTLLATATTLVTILYFFR